MKFPWKKRKIFSARPFRVSGLNVTLFFVLITIGGMFFWLIQGEAPSQFGNADVLRKINLERLDGSVDDFSDYRGKIVLLNVWATWCPPCRREMPALERLKNKLDPEKVVVLGVSVDRDALSVREYLNKIDVTFADHIDRKQVVTKKLLGVSALPSTFLFAKDGTVIKIIVGEREWDGESIIAALHNLYDDKDIDISVFDP